jgi:hypothetical protein
MPMAMGAAGSSILAESWSDFLACEKRDRSGGGWFLFVRSTTRHLQPNPACIPMSISPGPITIALLYCLAVSILTGLSLLPNPTDVIAPSCPAHRIHPPHAAGPSRPAHRVHLPNVSCSHGAHFIGAHTCASPSRPQRRSMSTRRWVSFPLLPYLCPLPTDVIIPYILLVNTGAQLTSSSPPEHISPVPSAYINNQETGTHSRSGDVHVHPCMLDLIFPCISPSLPCYATPVDLMSCIL